MSENAKNKLATGDYDGLKCECAAKGSCECGCDADWTPKELYEKEIMIEAKDKRIAELEKAMSVARERLEEINLRSGISEAGRAAGQEGKMEFKNILTVCREALTIINEVLGEESQDEG